MCHVLTDSDNVEHDLVHLNTLEQFFESAGDQTVGEDPGSPGSWRLTDAGSTTAPSKEQKRTYKLPLEARHSCTRDQQT